MKLNSYKIILMLMIGTMLLAPCSMAAKKRGGKRGGGNKEPQTQKVPKPDTVENVDVTNSEIKVATGQESRSILSYTVTKFIKIYVNDKPAKLEDVQKGMRVMVVAGTGKDAARIQAENYTPPPDEKKDGKEKK